MLRSTPVSSKLNDKDDIDDPFILLFMAYQFIIYGIFW